MLLTEMYQITMEIIMETVRYRFSIPNCSFSEKSGQGMKISLPIYDT